MLSTTFLADPPAATAGPPSPQSPLVSRLLDHIALSLSERAALNRLLGANIRTIRQRTVFIEAGVPQTEIGVIVQGWACRYKAIAGGARQIVALHLPGDVCDFNALLADANDTATAALSDLRVAAIGRQALGAFSAEFPRASQALWWESMVAASVQREWMVNICARNARQRIAHLLCELQVRLVAAGLGEAVGFACPLTQADLGNACGMTVEHTNRTLRELRADGLASFADRRIDILDWTGLQALAGFDPAYLHTGRVSHAELLRATDAGAIDNCLENATPPAARRAA